MDSGAMADLREIGAQLDQNRFPRVHDGGIVVPRDAGRLGSTRGKEKADVSRKRRSSAGPRKGPAGWQGQAVRPGSAGGASPVLGADLRERYEGELGALLSAYPDTRVWKHEAGMWLLTESAVLSGLGKKATFFVLVPFARRFRVRTWAFWTTALSVNWIGPRHTNFPDGSICAFEPRDQTWVPGGSLVKLFDFYTVWALRHLHLETFDRWPGYQSVPEPFERLQELRDDEYCGCEKSHKLYGECCKPGDLEKRASGIDFVLKRGRRQPPDDIVRFVRVRDQVPPLEKFLA